MELNKCDMIRYGLIEAYKAEIDGMKTANDERKKNNLSCAYNEDCFFEKAERIRDVVYTHDMQLLLQ